MPKFAVRHQVTTTMEVIQVVEAENITKAQQIAERQLKEGRYKTEPIIRQFGESQINYVSSTRERLWGPGGPTDIDID